MAMWIKHPRKEGCKGDTMLTLSVYGFAACVIKFMLNDVSLEVAGKVIKFGSIDSALIGAILIPTLGAYTARKFKNSPDNQGDKEKK